MTRRWWRRHAPTHSSISISYEGACCAIVCGIARRMLIRCEWGERWAGGCVAGQGASSAFRRSHQRRRRRQTHRSNSESKEQREQRRSRGAAESGRQGRSGRPPVLAPAPRRRGRPAESSAPRVASPCRPCDAAHRAGTASAAQRPATALTTAQCTHTARKKPTAAEQSKAEQREFAGQPACP